MFLISLPLPVSEHCAPAVSIATGRGGPHSEERWNGRWWRVSVGGFVEGVKVQGQVLAVMK